MFWIKKFGKLAFKLNWINAVKSIVLIYMLILFLVGLFIPFSWMMSIFMYTAIPFLMGSVGIYTFSTNEKDGELMMNIKIK